MCENTNCTAVVLVRPFSDKEPGLKPGPRIRPFGHEGEEKMRLRNLIVATSLLGALAGPVMAQYPERPITLLVGYAAGGTADIASRTYGAALERCLGTSIIVQNLPGAGGDIAYTQLQNATPDGYTLGHVIFPGVISNDISKEVAYSAEDFTMLGGVSGSAVFIMVDADSPWNSITDLLAAAEESPSPIVVATNSLGSSDHLAMAELAYKHDVDFTYLPLENSAAAANMVVGGHAPVAAASIAEQFRDQVKVLGIVADERDPRFPDVPTLLEQGVDVVGRAVAVIAGPPGLPEDIRDTVAACIATIPDDPTFVAEADQRGMVIVPTTAEQSAELAVSQRQVLQALWDLAPWVQN